MTKPLLNVTQAAWTEISEGYDAFVTPSHLWLGTQAVERAGVRAGEQFLDVAAGTGALSIPAARQGADVLATDLSPEMLEHLAKRAANDGLQHVQTRVMDGHQLEIEDDAFDVAGSQFGVMLFPDLPRAVREMRRVVRPGGRVLIVAYGPPSEIDFLTFFIAAVQAVVPGFAGLPTDPPPFEFQVADPSVLDRRLTEAGLRDTRVEQITETLRFASVDDLWSWLANSNPIGKHLTSDLGPEVRRMTREVLAGMLRERAGGGRYAELTNPINIGVGMK